MAVPRTHFAYSTDGMQNGPAILEGSLAISIGNKLATVSQSKKKKKITQTLVKFKTFSLPQSGAGRVGAYRNGYSSFVHNSKVLEIIKMLFGFRMVGQTVVHPAS